MRFKFSWINLLDIVIYVAFIVAVLEILSFIFMGAMYSWLSMLEQFPHLEDEIVGVFRYTTYYLWIIIIGCSYYMLRKTITLIKNGRRK